MSDWIALVDWLFYVAPSEPGYQSPATAATGIHMYFTLNNKYIVIYRCNQL